MSAVTRLQHRGSWAQVQRAAIAKDNPPPTGLYDAAVWERCEAVVAQAVAEGRAESEAVFDTTSFV